jgi:DNA-binding IclR family transcriptional regulator
MTTQTRRPGQVVPAVARAARVLDALAAGPPRQSLAELSRRLELPRSSTLALCGTLVDAGLLAREPDGAYRLGPHLLELSRAYLGQTGVHGAFERVSHELGVLPESTLVLSVLDGADVVYTGRRAGSRPVGVSYELGMRLPAHCTASGKALLAALSEAERDALLDAAYPDGLPALTARSLTDRGRLARELRRAGAAGVAIDDEETAPGMICVGAAVPGPDGRAAGAVAVSLVKAGVDEARLDRTREEIRRLAGAVSAAIGGPGPG